MSDGLTFYLGNSGFANGIFLTDPIPPSTAGTVIPFSSTGGWFLRANGSHFSQLVALLCRKELD